jgi:hypothetical protein
MDILTTERFLDLVQVILLVALLITVLVGRLDRK